MNLSRRQQEVTAMVVNGLTNQEIADRLFITVKTVKFHLTHIFAVEDVTSRAQLIVKYLAISRENNEFAKLMRELIK